MKFSAVFLLFFLQVFSIFPLRADNFRDFLFDLTKTSLIQKESEGLFALSKQGALLLLLPVWKSSECKLLYEYFFPERAGELSPELIEMTVNSSEDLFSVDSSEGDFENLDLLSALDGRDEGEKKEDGLQEMLNRLQDGSLRKFSYGDEKTSIVFSEGKVVLLNADEKLVVRRTFDSQYRLIKKEEFINPRNFQNFSQARQTDYSYSEAGFLSLMEMEDFFKKTKVSKTYQQEGKISSEVKIHYEQTEEENVLVKDSETFWEYDEAGRTKKILQVSFFPSKNKKNPEKREEITEFEYNFEQTPDTCFYEDGKLRIQTVYQGAGDFTKTVFFDGGFSVISRYYGGEKISETICQDGKELRSQKF